LFQLFHASEYYIEQSRQHARQHISTTGQNRTLFKVENKNKSSELMCR